MSTCPSSVTSVHSTQAIEIFGNVSVKIYGDRPRGTFPSGVKHKRGSQNIAILDLLKAISRKRCKIRGKLIVITNRKSHVSFRLVPNTVIYDLERRNSPN